MEVTPFARASGVALLAFATLVTASAMINLVTGDPALAAWPGLVGSIACFIGLACLYISRVNELTRWAPIAFIPAVTGLALSVGMFYGLTFSPPRTGPLGPLFPLGYGPFLYGFLPIGALILITGSLPRPAALLLVAGVALNAAGFATPEIRLAGIVVFSAGIAWIGTATARTPILAAVPVSKGVPNR